MGNISVDYDVLNQKGSPAWYSDLFANIPTPGYKGRMFISTDTFAFYRDNGTGWDLTGGPGTGTITGAGVSGQLTYFIGTDVISGNNNLFYDITNGRLGINTATPGSPLDIHSSGTAAQFNGTTTNNAFVFFQNAGTSKWRIGNLYNSGANDYQIYDVLNATARLTIKNTGATTLTGTFTATSLIKSGGTSSQILLADGTTTPTSTFGAGSVTSVSAITLGTSGTDLSSSVANSTTTPVITLNVPTASATNRGALSSADWTTFNNKQATITLTTTGTSGAATLVGATLNIPNYTNVGTVTSVAALTLGTTGTDLSSSVANSTSTPVITLNVPTASATNRGALSSTDWTTFNSKQATISVTAPVVLTGATISMPAATTSVSGYLTSTDWNTFNNKTSNLGTVTDVVALTIGTTGIDITSTAVTTTTTPVITLNIPTASASNRGALSSTDWTTFNNKQSALTNPVTGTGTTNYLPKFTGTSTIGNSGITDDGTTVTLVSRALSGTSASFSGLITSTLGNNTVLYNSVSATTGYQYVNIQSSGARLIFGIEAATSAGVFTGTLDNSAVIGSSSATGAFHIGSNSIVRQTIFSGGNIGIGTTNDAGYKLDVNGTGRFSGAVTIGASSLITGSDRILELRGPGSNNSALLRYSDGTVAKYSVGFNNNEYIIFDDVANVRRLQITSGGLVGINCTPSNQLTIKPNAYDSNAMVITRYDSDGYQAVTLGTENTANGFILLKNSSNTSTVKLSTSGASYFNGGNVLIGTTTDSGYKLDVNGTGRFTGQLHIPNNSTGTNAGLFFDYNVNTASRSWCIVSDYDAYGDFQIKQSTTQTGTTFTKILGFSPTGAATFSSTLGINGTSNNVRSGTYTPTVTAGTNCAAVTSYPCQYMQVDKVVTVSGYVYGSATAITTETQFTMSTPVNTNFTQVYQCGGTGRSAQGGVSPSGAGYVASISANATNEVRFSYTAPAVLGTGGYFWFSFTYQII